jgi:hypothetical protein
MNAEITATLKAQAGAVRALADALDAAYQANYLSGPAEAVMFAKNWAAAVASMVPAEPAPVELAPTKPVTNVYRTKTGAPMTEEYARLNLANPEACTEDELVEARAYLASVRAHLHQL